MRFRIAFYTVVFLLCFNSVWAQSELVLVSSDGPPIHNSEETGFLDLLLRDAFGRAGVKVKIIELPGERAMVNVNTGIDDGEMNRIAGLEKDYPNIMAIPETILDYQFVAFTKRKDVSIRSWADLKPYSVAFLRGWKIFEYNVTEPIRFTKAETVKHLFEMLVGDRVDVVLLERWMGLVHLRNNGITGIRVLEQPLAVRKMYTYLHKKHKDLLPKVAAALREIKADGTYQEYVDRVFGPLESNSELSR